INVVCRNSPHPAKATLSPHPMRGEGRVRGAVGYSTIGFISEMYFGNCSSSAGNSLSWRVGDDSRYSLFQRSRRPPILEDERVGFILLKMLNVVDGFRSGDHRRAHLLADDPGDLNNFRPGETGDVEIFVPGNGFVQYGELVQA